LLDWLNGFVDQSPCLDAEMVAAEAADTTSSAAAGAMDVDELGRPTKRQRTEDMVATVTEFSVPPAFEFEGDAGNDVNSSSSSSSVDGKPPSQWTIEDILMNEVPYSTHTSVMTARKDLSSVLQIFQNAQRNAEKASTPARSAAAAYAAATPRTPAGSYPTTPSSASASGFGGPPTPAAGSARRPSSSHKGRPGQLPGPEATVPIIVIPQAAASLVQMANVYDLLHNGIFVEPAVKKEELKRAKQAIPTEVEIEHASKLNPSKNAKYKVVDDVKKLKKEDWARVVAVFASGAQWYCLNACLRLLSLFVALSCSKRSIR